MTCMDNKALIVVDVQNDFMSWGALPVYGAENVIPAINKLIPEYSTVVLTQDWHPGNHISFATSSDDFYKEVELPYGPQILWPAHCIMGSSGAEFASALNTTTANLIVRKGCNSNIDSYSAFFENDHVTPTGLHGYLQSLNITKLDFVGVAYDYCVSWSAIDAAKLGYETTVIANACAAIDLDGSLSQEISKMKQHGVIINEN